MMNQEILLVGFNSAYILAGIFGIILAVFALYTKKFAK